MVADRPVREWGHQGRTYIEGRKGSKFTLRFRNNTAQRVLAVPSIDGLCALDGQPATGASKGYIIAAYSSAEIKGWKMNLRETADFVFTDRETTSYAAQTHGAQNGGIIAVKVFAEKYVPPVVTQVVHTWSETPVVREIHHHHPDPRWHPWPSTIYCSTTGGGSLINSLACGPTYTSNASNIGAAAGSTANYDAMMKAPGVPTDRKSVV